MADTQEATTATENKPEQKSMIELFLEHPEVRDLKIKPKIEVIDREHNKYRLINQMATSSEGSTSTVWPNPNDLSKPAYMVLSAFTTNLEFIPPSLWVSHGIKGLFELGEEKLMLELPVEKDDDGILKLSSDMDKNKLQQVPLTVSKEFVYVDKFTQAFWVGCFGPVPNISDYNKLIVESWTLTDDNPIPGALDKAGKPIKLTKEQQEIFEFKVKALKTANELIPKGEKLWRERNPGLHSIKQ